MKLVFFDDFKLGVVNGGNVVDVGAAVSGIVHTSPQDLINLETVIGQAPPGLVPSPGCPAPC